MTIAKHEQPASLPDQMRFAEALASSNLLPKAYAKQPANVLLAMQLGDALGIPPIQAINGIHVVEGKPTASADLIASLVRRAGHKLRIREEGAGDGLRVTATLIRADDPEFPFEAVWDMPKARAAQLTGKGVWKQYPGQMLRARAITEVARMGASDALYGVIYTPEELGGQEPSASVRQVEPEPEPAGPVVTLAEAVAVEPEGRDWLAEMEAHSNDLDALLALWRDARAAGAGADVLDAIVAAGHAAREQAAAAALAEAGAEQVDDETGEVVDAEVVA